MTLKPRALTGLSVGVSISQSEESGSLGFSTRAINRITLQFSAAILGQGASVAFGQDWREDGVMEAISEFAQRSTQYGVREAGRSAPLRNLLAWPDVPRLSQDQQEELRSTLSVEQVKVPDGVRQISEILADTDDARAYVRARALTQMRRELNATTHARICLGGRLTKFAGRYPGIVEEAYLAVQSGKPIYLVGALGGATAQLIECLSHAEGDRGQSESRRIGEIYRRISPLEHGASEDREVNLAEVWAIFGNLGTEGLSRNNRLTETQNEELFDTRSIERAIELILIGLSEVHAPQR